MQPSAKTSDAAVAWPVVICSGLSQPGLPTISPLRVRGAASAAAAMPKSMTFGPVSAHRTLDGFRSRCTTPSSWMDCRPSARPTASAICLAASSGPPASISSVSEGPSTYSVAIHGCSASVSKSNSRTVQTPETRNDAWTSRRKRARKCGSSPSSGRTSFIATRPRGPSARYTMPMPPPPIRPSTS